MKTLVLSLLLLGMSSVPAENVDREDMVITRSQAVCRSYRYSSEASGYVCSSPSRIDYVEAREYRRLEMRVRQLENSLKSLEASR